MPPINYDDADFNLVEDTGGSYGNKNSITYQEILMNQLARITKIASQELREGFWKTLPMKSGTGAMIMTQVWIGDGRKEYINAIQCLHDLLLPQFDAEIIKKIKEFDERTKTKREDYAEKNKSESEFVNFELKLNRELFQQLNLLVGRKGFFEEQEMWG